MAITTVFLESGTFSVSASKNIDVSCWGAGGDGNANGTGGSGAAFASSSITVESGSYTVNVGLSNYDGLGNGGVSNFISASVILVQAAGGRSDGTVGPQTSYITGSLKRGGGRGGLFSANYGNYGSGGGGSAAGPHDHGQDGQSGYDSGASFSQYGHAFTGSVGASGHIAEGGDGGNGSYYFAGTDSRLVAASNGQVPGGGGGGGYTGENNAAIKTEGNGGHGMVTIRW